MPEIEVVRTLRKIKVVAVLIFIVIPHPIESVIAQRALIGRAAEDAIERILHLPLLFEIVIGAQDVQATRNRSGWIQLVKEVLTSWDAGNFGLCVTESRGDGLEERAVAIVERFRHTLLERDREIWKDEVEPCILWTARELYEAKTRQVVCLTRSAYRK